jgi:hypothetical protein
MGFAITVPTREAFYAELRLRRLNIKVLVVVGGRSWNGVLFWLPMKHRRS